MGKTPGKVYCDKGDCTRGANTYHSWHWCTKPCTDCQGKLVLLSKRVLKTGKTNKYHEAGTVCTLKTVEGKSLDREPQASIRIDTRTGSEYHTVGSRNLETGLDNTPFTERIGIQSPSDLRERHRRQTGSETSQLTTVPQLDELYETEVQLLHETEAPEWETESRS